ncbi:MAG: hypothetical protein DRG31_00680 [Deltaproteobacteria bacterium]|nr:MAG: hypothetical protein DRG31_00680 [Deltaproteobacteria bacterium]
MKLRIRENKTLRKRVYEYLRDRILKGELPPRERLVESRIAKALGVSRTPVREALHNLEMEGLLEALPRMGYIVKPISEEEVEEICEIRKLIETLAVRWAMQRNRERLIRDLRKNLEATERKIAKGNPKVFVGMDAQFHEIIARHSGSKRLLEMAQMLRRHMLRYRIESIYTMDNVIKAMGGHKAVLRAIEGGDPEEVEKALRRHIEQSKEDILRYAFGRPMTEEGITGG